MLIVLSQRYFTHFSVIVFVFIIFFIERRISVAEEERYDIYGTPTIGYYKGVQIGVTFLGYFIRRM